MERKVSAMIATLREQAQELIDLNGDSLMNGDFTAKEIVEILIEPAMEFVGAVLDFDEDHPDRIATGPLAKAARASDEAKDKDIVKWALKAAEQFLSTEAK